MRTAETILCAAGLVALSAGVLWGQPTPVDLDDLDDLDIKPVATTSAPTTQAAAPVPVAVPLATKQQPTTWPAKADGPGWIRPGPDGLTGALNAYWREEVSRRDRLVALRDARQELLEQLARKLLAVEFAEGKTVARLLAASDDPAVDFRRFLLGADVTGYRPAQSAPVMLCKGRLSTRGALTTFKGWADRHAAGQEEALRALERFIETLEGKDMLTAIGVGVTPAGGRWAHLMRRGGWPGRLGVTGDGASPEAARAVARTAMQDRLAALPLWDRTTVAEWINADPRRVSVMSAVLDQAEETTPVRGPDGRVAVSRGLDPERLWVRIVDAEIAEPSGVPVKGAAETQPGVRQP